MQAKQDSEKGIETASYSVSAVNHFFRSSNLTIAAALGQLFRSVAQSLVRYLFLPVNVLTSILTASFSWRRAYLNGFKPHGLAKAILETLTACAMVAAMIGAIVANMIFSVVAPAISAATICAKALFNLGSAIHFGLNAHHALNDTDRTYWRDKAKNAILEGLVGLIIVAALTVLIVFASPAVKLAAQVIGIIGSAAACGIALKKIHDNRKVKDKTKYQSTHAKLTQHLGSGFSQPQPVMQSEDCPSDQTIEARNDNYNDYDNSPVTRAKLMPR